MLKIITPSESTLPWRPHSAVPLGSCLLVTDIGRFLADRRAVESVAANEYAALAVITPTDPYARGMLATATLHKVLRPFVSLPASCEASQRESETRTALARVDSPTRAELARMVDSLVGSPAFIRAIRAELGVTATPKRSSRHRTFRLAGPLTGQAWSGRNDLVQALALALPGRVSSERAALEIGIDPRTLRSHCRLLLGLDWRSARRCFGWRWAVVSALQHHGYIHSGSTHECAHRLTRPPRRQSRPDVGAGVADGMP